MGGVFFDSRSRKLVNLGSLSTKINNEKIKNLNPLDNSTYKMTIDSVVEGPLVFTLFCT